MSIATIVSRKSLALPHSHSSFSQAHVPQTHLLKVIHLKLQWRSISPYPGGRVDAVTGVARNRWFITTAQLAEGVWKMAESIGVVRWFSVWYGSSVLSRFPTQIRTRFMSHGQSSHTRQHLTGDRSTNQLTARHGRAWCTISEFDIARIPTLFTWLCRNPFGDQTSNAVFIDQRME